MMGPMIGAAMPETLYVPSSLLPYVPQGALGQFSQPVSQQGGVTSFQSPYGYQQTTVTPQFINNLASGIATNIANQQTQTITNSILNRISRVTGGLL